MESSERDAIIEKYLQNKSSLTNEQRIFVEKNLRSDAKFAARVESFDALNKALNLSEELYIRDFLNKKKAEGAVKKISIRRVIKFAAVFIPLLVAMGVLFMLFYNSDEQIANRYLVPHISSQITKNASVNKDTLLGNFLTLYNDEQYIKVIELSNSIDDTNLNSEYHLILANAFLQEKQLEEAFQELMKIKPEDMYFVERQRYLVFVYLLQGQREKAINQLNEIIDSDLEYRGEAISILKDLNV